jgi:uncharacterized membrane protein YgcG
VFCFFLPLLLLVVVVVLLLLLVFVILVVVLAGVVDLLGKQLPFRVPFLLTSDTDVVTFESFLAGGSGGGGGGGGGEGGEREGTGLDALMSFTDAFGFEEATKEEEEEEARFDEEEEEANA